jgi:hypothetical protein
MGRAILILDGASHRRVGACIGPDPEGACPRVRVGAVLPCAGADLVPGWLPGASPYSVSKQMTICPLTLAEALAVPSDSALVA